MGSLLSFWSALDVRRQVAVAAATLAVFVSVLLLGRIALSPTMALLYSGLDARAAGEVVAALEARAVPYEVRGDAIHVPVQERDALRLALAAEGLPAQGGAGYELLDSLSGFGTTAQMFDAAWSRAVEGELVRTILANPQIRAARVHVARGNERPFARDAGASASVFVTTVAGLSADQARALRHLVAAAVTGLRPDRVEIIDSVAGLIPLGDGGPTSSAPMERAEAIRRNVERLLEARVGPGRSVVEVTVDVVTESEQVSERRIDPEGRVATRTETETLSGTENRAGGDVTVASNLPDGDAGEGPGDSTTSDESRERVEYALSETRREVTRLPGDIRRITVAVLIDGERTTSEEGTTTWQPRPEAEMEALRELIASAAGIDAARGDVLTLKSLEIMPAQAGAGEGDAAPTLDFVRLLGIAALAVVALGLAFFVLRPALRQARAPARAALPPLSIGNDRAPDMGPALTGEIAGDFGLPDLPVIGADGTLGPPEEDPVVRLRRLIEERRTESLEILKTWMDSSGGRT